MAEMTVRAPAWVADYLEEQSRRTGKPKIEIMANIFTKALKGEVSTVGEDLKTSPLPTIPVPTTEGIFLVMREILSLSNRVSLLEQEFEKHKTSKEVSSEEGLSDDAILEIIEDILEKRDKDDWFGGFWGVDYKVDEVLKQLRKDHEVEDVAEYRLTRLIRQAIRERQDAEEE